MNEIDFKIKTAPFFLVKRNTLFTITHTSPSTPQHEINAILCYEEGGPMNEIDFKFKTAPFFLVKRNTLFTITHTSPSTPQHEINTILCY